MLFIDYTIIAYKHTVHEDYFFYFLYIESETRPVDAKYATGYNVKFTDAFQFLLISQVSFIIKFPLLLMLLSSLSFFE